tara:strand:+ start:2150 stop:3115 length:966 start_codon:yes stop_codon:yes gene_type:complete
MKKICVIGAGKWGINHIETLYRLKALFGVVESDENKIKLLKKKYPSIKYFTNIDKALEYGFDGFTVATPAETHYEISKKIINSNHHVLVEKPFTTKLDEAIELVKLAEKKNVNLMVGHLLLFHPAFTKIKEMLDNDKLGKLQYMYSNRLNLGTIRTEENVFWSFAPHDIALFQYFTNLEPINISSSGTDILQNGIHDSTITTIKYPKKIMGHIFVSWLHPFKEHRFVIIGSKGMILFEDSRQDKPLLFYNKTISWENGVPLPNDHGVEKIIYENEMPLDNEIKYYLEHLDDNQIKISNGYSGIEVIKILTEATNSLKKEIK